MTREQAIEHGKSQLEVFGGEHREFIKLAIKALEQGPCDKCEVGNPCLYCKYGFEPQESEETDGTNK